MIDISKVSKAQVLATLYNSSKPQGFGLLHYTPEDMSVETAQSLLDDGCVYFDYVQGRVMKIDLKGTTLDPRLYDRDNGEGAAQAALDKIL